MSWPPEPLSCPKPQPDLCFYTLKYPFNPNIKHTSPQPEIAPTKHLTPEPSLIFLLLFSRATLSFMESVRTTCQIFTLSSLPCNPSCPELSKT